MIACNATILEYTDFKKFGGKSYESYFYTLIRQATPKCIFGIFWGAF